MARFWVHVANNASGKVSIIVDLVKSTRLRVILLNAAWNPKTGNIIELLELWGAARRNKYSEPNLSLVVHSYSSHPTRGDSALWISDLTYGAIQNSQKRSAFTAGTLSSWMELLVSCCFTLAAGTKMSCNRYTAVIEVSDRLTPAVVEASD